MQEMTKAHLSLHSLALIADMRDLELLRLQMVTEVLRDKVREEHAAGMTVSKLAKVSNVTRRTIRQWIE